MKTFHFAVITALLPCTVLAADLPCTTPVAPNTPASQFEGKAKLSEEQARHYALQSVNAPQTAYAEGELKVQMGCLVYRFDITVPGKQGTQEIVVDAGDGTILLHSTIQKEKQPKAPKIK